MQLLLPVEPKESGSFLSARSLFYWLFIFRLGNRKRKKMFDN
jgi:hypothetical protein